MIKFVHRRDFEKSKNKSKIVVTYTTFEIILGSLLFISNLIAVIIIYKYFFTTTPRPIVKTTAKSAYSPR